jgi:hypothetical protein
MDLLTQRNGARPRRTNRMKNCVATDVPLHRRFATLKRERRQPLELGASTIGPRSATAGHCAGLPKYLTQHELKQHHPPIDDLSNQAISPQ